MLPINIHNLKCIINPMIWNIDIYYLNMEVLITDLPLF